jgi:mRNA interferase MazF
MKNPKYFDLWYINWNPGRVSEQIGVRPGLIVQNDLANQNNNYPNTIVLAVSTKGKKVPFHIEITPSEKNGLKEISFIKCEQIMTISKDRLLTKIGTLEDIYKSVTEKALIKVLNIG